jgi:hypothetical protein
MHPPQQPHVFVSQLSREWEHLRRRPADIAHAQAWAAEVTGGALATTLRRLTDLEQIVTATGAVGADEVADVALLDLVSLAQHDQLVDRGEQPACGDDPTGDRGGEPVPATERRCEVGDRVVLAGRMHAPSSARCIDDVEGWNR